MFVTAHVGHGLPLALFGGNGTRRGVAPRDGSPDAPCQRRPLPFTLIASEVCIRGGACGVPQRQPQQSPLGCAA